jgi:hypothetical protein
MATVGTANPGTRRGKWGGLHAQTWPMQGRKPIRQALKRFNLPHFFLVVGAGTSFRQLATSLLVHERGIDAVQLDAAWAGTAAITLR